MNKNSSPSNKKAWQSLQLGVTLKITIALGIVMILIAIIQILYSTNSTRQQIETESLKQLQGYNNIYITHIEAESNAAQALALSIASREDIQELYQSGDRDGLYKLLQPLFEELKKHQIVHLYIENPDGTVFLRVHNPEKFGDNITYRGTAADALAERTSTAGVEIGPSRIGIRGLAPMNSHGKFIGLIEVGVDFDQQFISTLKELTGADYTLWITNEAAAPASLKPIEGSPTSPFDGMFYYASSTQNLLPISSETYRLILKKNEPVFQIYTEGVTIPSMVYITPLLGYKGKVLGLMEISFPYTSTIKTQNSSILTIIAITVGLTLLGLFVIAFINSQVILKPLATLSGFAKKQLEGNLEARVLVQTGDEFEQLAKSFNDLAETIEGERRSLEQRISNRTKALTTSAEVSRRLSVASNSNQLANDVVEQVQAAFNYYHSHIYFVDEATGDLIMAGGTGEAGAAMLARGHKIPKGRGLVGRAADTNTPVLVPDVSQAEGWLPNPLLPDTKSEAAIPISSGKQVLGVLDVQQNVVNGLGEEDVTLLQSLAGQVAISLQNTRFYEQSKAQADLESLVNAIGQKIQRATTVEDTLQTAIREIGLALGAARVSADIGTGRRHDTNEASRN